MARTSPRAYANISTGDAATDAMQGRIDMSLAQLASCPILAGRAVEVRTKIGEVVVEHKLGRAPLGWFPVGMAEAHTNLFETTRDNKRLVLLSDAAASVVLWVY